MKTKTKFILIFSVVFLLTLQTKAQIFSGGIVGGISTAAVKLQNVNNGFSNVVQGNNIYGFEAGVFAKVMISPFYIKPMALYNFSTGNVNGPNPSETNSANNFMLNRLEVPVLLGLKIIGPFSIEGGPVYNYIIQSNSQFGNDNINVTKGTGLGYRIGVAAEISRLIFNVSYGGVTVNTNGLDNASFKEPYKVIVGLGIKLGTTKSNK